MQWTRPALVYVITFRRQAITRTNADSVSIGPLGTKLSEIRIEIQNPSRKCTSKYRLWNGSPFAEVKMSVYPFQIQFVELLFQYGKNWFHTIKVMYNASDIFICINTNQLMDFSVYSTSPSVAIGKHIYVAYRIEWSIIKATRRHQTVW